jgi:hypothetical protein
MAGEIKMKSYGNIYYLCRCCGKVYNSYNQMVVEEPTKEQKELLIKGHCEKCFKEGLRKLEKII